MQKILIFGASGHGSVVLDCILQEGKYDVVGFIDSFIPRGVKVNDYVVLGTENDLPYLIEKHQIHGGIIAIGDNWTRSLVAARVQKIAPEFNFVRIVHPKAVLGRNVQIGKGSIVMPGVIVNANTVVGSHCILNTNSSLDHDSFMSDFSSLAPNVCVGANLKLGLGSAICLGTNVIENVTIGKYAVVGAGSLVLRNISDNAVVYGSPAKFVRIRTANESYLTGKKNNVSDSTLSRVKIS